MMILGVVLVVITFGVSVVEWIGKRGKGLTFHEWFYSDRTERMALSGAGLIAVGFGLSELGW